MMWTSRSHWVVQCVPSLLVCDCLVVAGQRRGNNKFILTFHLNVELSQLVLQLTLQHTHVLQTGSEREIYSWLPNISELLICCFYMTLSSIPVLFILFLKFPPTTLWSKGRMAPQGVLHTDHFPPFHLNPLFTPSLCPLLLTSVYSLYPLLASARLSLASLLPGEAVYAFTILLAPSLSLLCRQ